jgi:hypothetical protein
MVECIQRSSMIHKFKVQRRDSEQDMRLVVAKVRLEQEILGLAASFMLLTLIPPLCPFHLVPIFERLHKKI